MSNQTTTESNTSDFKNLVDLLALFSDGTARLAAMQAEINQEYFGLVDERRKEYADLQEAVTKAESAIEALAVAHPEWFTKKKSVATAYGSVSSRSTPRLEVANEEASILLIKHAFEQDPEAAAKLLRAEETLNIEALENLDDAELRRFRIKRVREEKIKVTPKKIDLGKAVNSAGAENEEAA